MIKKFRIRKNHCDTLLINRKANNFSIIVFYTIFPPLIPGSLRDKLSLTIGRTFVHRLYKRT